MIDFKNWRKILTVPNILTLIRLLLIPVMAYLIYHMDRYQYWGFISFILVWSTDMLDGFIARKYNQISDFGKLFDPAVDKIFQLTTATTLYWINRLPIWVLVFLLIKELLQVVGSLILYKKEMVVSSTLPGKLSTVFWVLGFATMFFLPEKYLHCANYIFIAPLICALWAFITYLFVYLRNFSEI